MGIRSTKVVKPWWAAIFVVVLFSTLSLAAQEVVDKTVAVVGDGVRSELITYSDLLWQLALQPGIQVENPKSEDLNRALQTLINQRLFALESRRLPRAAPSERETADKIAETLAFFPSSGAFEVRLKQVGFESVKDPAFENLISQRVAIEKYVDFRFASFVVVTADEEKKFYTDTFTADFRRRSPGLLLPPLDEKRVEIREEITQQKIAAAIERFLDEAKRRITVEILIPV
ncbi:MAG: hypothetical protein WKF34_01580 [Pyrinomonadaceae bacterium]